MLLMSRNVTRITYTPAGEAVVERWNSKSFLRSTTLCERQSRLLGSMPFTSLNRVRTGRQLAPTGAWQHRIGLPEGALMGLRLNILTDLSNPDPHFDIRLQLSTHQPASPCAGERALSKNGSENPRIICGARHYGSWSASYADALSPANQSQGSNTINAFARA